MNRRDLFIAAAGAAAGAAAACVPVTVIHQDGYLATPKNTPPSEVYDGTGSRVKDVLWVHTGTGEAEVYVRDAHGKKQINAAGTDIVKRKVILPLPITLRAQGNA